jgi:hypothetical protein
MLLFCFSPFLQRLFLFFLKSNYWHRALLMELVIRLFWYFANNVENSNTDFLKDPQTIYLPFVFSLVLNLQIRRLQQ